MKKFTKACILLALVSSAFGQQVPTPGDQDAQQPAPPIVEEDIGADSNFFSDDQIKTMLQDKLYSRAVNRLNAIAIRIDEEFRKEFIRVVKSVAADKTSAIVGSGLYETGRVRGQNGNPTSTAGNDAVEAIATVLTRSEQEAVESALSRAEATLARAKELGEEIGLSLDGNLESDYLFKVPSSSLLSNTMMLELAQHGMEDLDIFPMTPIDGVSDISVGTHIYIPKDLAFRGAQTITHYADQTGSKCYFQLNTGYVQSPVKQTAISAQILEINEDSVIRTQIEETFYNAITRPVEDPSTVVEATPELRELRIKANAAKNDKKKRKIVKKAVKKMDIMPAARMATQIMIENDRANNASTAEVFNKNVQDFMNAGSRLALKGGNTYGVYSKPGHIIRDRANDSISGSKYVLPVCLIEGDTCKPVEQLTGLVCERIVTSDDLEKTNNKLSFTDFVLNGLYDDRYRVGQAAVLDPTLSEDSNKVRNSIDANQGDARN